jgi:hypothetical protein
VTDGRRKRLTAENAETAERKRKEGKNKILNI